MKAKGIILISLIAAAVALAAWFMLGSRGGNVVPKPRGYYRIALADKSYTEYQSDCGVKMEVNASSKVEVINKNNSKDSCWFNIYYPRHKARLHCTYFPIHNNFEKLIGEAYEFAVSHEMKASAMKRTLIEDTDRNMFGIIYDIEGEAASQLQFFLTDSTKHFFRGSLYFFNSPNPDSIAPVLDYVRQDVLRITQTLKWQ
jgi:gliding motility-associated lipoprotein GldD